jgi:hypothetical protein
MNHADKYKLWEAVRALDYKGPDVTNGGIQSYGGIPVLSTHGLSANKIIVGNMTNSEDSCIKAATWMTDDISFVQIDRLQANSVAHFVKISADFGVHVPFTDEVVYYLPA